MGVFGNGYIKNTREDNLSESQIEEIYNALFVLEKYFDDIDLINYNNDIIDESVKDGFKTNLSAHKYSMEASKKIRATKVKIKKAMKNKQYSEAIKYAEEGKKDIEKIKSDLDKLDWNKSDSNAAYVLFRAILLVISSLIFLIDPSTPTILTSVILTGSRASLIAQDSLKRDRYALFKPSIKNKPIKMADIIVALDKYKETLDKLIDKAKKKQKEDKKK